MPQEAQTARHGKTRARPFVSVTAVVVAVLLLCILVVQSRPRPRRFVSSKWLADGTRHRLSMVEDLLQNHMQIGLDAGTVTDRIGPPTTREQTLLYEYGEGRKGEWAIERGPLLLSFVVSTNYTYLEEMAAGCRIGRANVSNVVIESRLSDVPLHALLAGGRGVDEVVSLLGEPDVIKRGQMWRYVLARRWPWSLDSVVLVVRFDATGRVESYSAREG